MSLDFFSGHAKLYAEFRPSYPDELFQFISKHVSHFDRAWDCGTGNGQVAQHLVNSFKRIDATDISEPQLRNAFQHPVIHYQLCEAEHTPFESHVFDLVCVAQAIHWFDRDAFYAEVKRVVKPGGIIAVWGYNICSVDAVVDPVLKNYYKNIVGSYWHPRRQLVDEAYKTISFPFKEMATNEFHITERWSLDHFAGYLTSWSATQNYIKKNNLNPAEQVRKQLESHWSDKIFEVRFPIFMRLGVV